MERDAIISPCGLYRYKLTRKWNSEALPATFVMLNPSTADASIDDPTIRKCIGFANRWGNGSIVVVNLFAFRATEPKDMKRAQDPVGPHNWHHLESACVNAKLNQSPLIAAWGANGNIRNQGEYLLERCRNVWQTPIKALRLTAKGRDPEHPLYVPYDVEPVALP